jgi:beta-N-acetylhexosaminidase
MHRRKLLLGGTLGFGLATGAFLRFRSGPRDSLEARDYARDCASALLMAGFEGTTANAPSAQALAAQIGAGHVAGVIFVKDNIGQRDDVLGLTRLFAAAAPKTILLAIDHEGGVVQRLTALHGCADLPAARKLAQTRTPDQARALYREAGRAIAAMGFNFNLAPVVDRHRDDNPAIGHYDRAFSDNPSEIAAYAEAFVDGFGEAGISCTLKHFPGQGGARADSHLGQSDLPDWSDSDLAPFRRLIAAGKARAVMSGFAHLSSDEPAALSRAVMTGLLREKLGFHGVALTDDLDMGALGFGADRAAVAIQALRAGNDLLMIRNRSHADADLPGSLARCIEAGLAAGVLDRRSLDRSRRRMATLRAHVAQAA